MLKYFRVKVLSRKLILRIDDRDLNTTKLAILVYTCFNQIFTPEISGLFDPNVALTFSLH